MLSHGLFIPNRPSSLRVLLLGGTSEASHLAKALADRSVEAIFSYAGRTHDPLPQPLPTRVGGFGGPSGLTQWLESQKITHIIDATHPFAQQISQNVMTAADTLDLPRLSLERPPWDTKSQTSWRNFPSFTELVSALPTPPQNIFLAIGRTQLHHFAKKSQHRYLVRLVNSPSTPLPIPHPQIVIGRGPFRPEQDIALMQKHSIQTLVAKNSGGSGGEAKLQAAQYLGLPVYLVDRPQYFAPRTVVSTVEDALDWLSL